MTDDAADDVTSDHAGDGTGDHAPTPREVLTWEAFGVAGRQLAQPVVDDGYRPDLILTVARGGLLPAGALGITAG